MSKKKTTATATAAVPFHLADSKATDWRRNLGITDDRATQIIALIASSTKGNKDGAMAPAMEAVGNLPLENERLFGAWAIGHGAGQNDPDSDNPLADLLGENDDDTEGPDYDPLGDQDAN